MQGKRHVRCEIHVGKKNIRYNWGNGILGNYSYGAGLGTSCNLQRDYVKLRAPFAHSGHFSDLYIIIKFRIGLLFYFAKSHFTATLTLTATYLSG